MLAKYLNIFQDRFLPHPPQFIFLNNPHTLSFIMRAVLVLPHQVCIGSSNDSFAEILRLLIFLFRQMWSLTSRFTKKMYLNVFISDNLPVDSEIVTVLHFITLYSTYCDMQTHL
jgi:hypothetical protein